MIAKYLNYSIIVEKARNGAFTGVVRNVDNLVILTIEPAESQARALMACKHIAHLDMNEAAEAVARGERH